MIKKKGILTALLILILIAIACKTEVKITEEKVKDIQSTIQLLDEIDQKHGTKFREEQIPNKLIGFSTADNLVADIKKIKEIQAKMNLTEKTGTSTLQNVLTNLTEAREKMIESQKYFQQALNLGEGAIIKFKYNDDGTPVINTTTINCTKKEEIIKAADLIEKSFETATQAKLYMDDVLQQSEEARDKIGINDKKPRFYLTPFAEVKRQAEVNRFVANWCKTREKVYKQ